MKRQRGSAVLRVVTGGVIVLVTVAAVYTLWIVLMNFRNIGV